jgi:multiple sugar transport system permease protein
MKRPWLWLAPAVSALAALTFAPLLATLWLSLHRRLPVFQLHDWAGLDNYRKLAFDPRFGRSLAVTLYFTAASVAIELAAGLAAALALRGDFRGRAWAMGMLLLPWIVPSPVAARMWSWIFDAQFGVLNYLLVSFGVLRRPLAWLGRPWLALHAAILADAWKTTPFMALLLLAGLRSISPGLERAARADGAGPVRTFFRVTLPSIMPMLQAAVLFRALDAWRVFDVVYVMTAGGPADATETLSIYAYKTFFTTLDLGYGSALAFAIVFGAGLLSAAFLFLTREATA